jgi:hypothetical protein
MYLENVYKILKAKIKDKVDRYYTPTIATWFGFFARAVSFVLVLPMLLHKLDPERIAVWYLFDSILVFQLLLDTGFRVTLVRLVAYSFGGKNVFDDTQSQSDKSNWPLIFTLYKVFRKYYLIVALLFVSLVGSIGTLSLINPISKISEFEDAWTAWALLLLTTTIRMYCGVYISILEGINKIVFLRTLDALTAIAAVICAFLALYFFKPSLFNLVCCYQFWLLFNCLRDKLVVNSIFRNNLEPNVQLIYLSDQHRKSQILVPSVKSGFSSLFSVGTNHATNIAIAQFTNATILAPYLLAFRIIYLIRDVSMAPFYSKIPYLSQLRAKGANQELLQVAKRGMFLSYLVFVLAFITIGLFFPMFMKIFKSQVMFVDMKTWTLLGFAFLLHRYGAMHIQLQIVGNVIKSHIADGLSAAIYAFTLLLTYNAFGIQAIPISLIVSYLSFYCWYAGLITINTYHINLMKFEVKGFLAALAIFIGGAILIILI